jgi:hypothetical protein
MRLDLDIFIPEQKKFLMYFDSEVVQIDLDESYLFAPETAREHAQALVQHKEIAYRFLTPTERTASTLQDIPSDYMYMCLPRSVTDRISKIGLGHLGPKVRAILQAAHFPILIPSSVLKKWKNVVVFFGGSANALNALKVGITITRTTKTPLTLFIQSEGKDLDEYRSIIRKAGLLEALDACDALWSFFPNDTLENNLYTVPHDALVIAGAYGQGVIKTVLFGSKMELLQSTLPNNFLIVGPGYTG